jgi:hypothetical protein
VGGTAGMDGNLSAPLLREAGKTRRVPAEAAAMGTKDGSKYPLSAPHKRILRRPLGRASARPASGSLAPHS